MVLAGSILMVPASMILMIPAFDAYGSGFDDIYASAVRCLWFRRSRPLVVSVRGGQVCRRNRELMHSTLMVRARVQVVRRFSEGMAFDTYDPGFE